MTATRRTAVPVDKEGVLLKKKSIRAKQLSGQSQAANDRTALGKLQLSQFRIRNFLDFQIHFKQFALRRQKGRLDGLSQVNRLHRSAVGLHLRAQLRQVLRRGV